MKIYKNKNTGALTIIFSKNEKSPDVCLVSDKGTGKLRNVFGGEVSRYTYHCANAFGDSGYCTSTNKFKLDKEDVSYKIIRRR